MMILLSLLIACDGGGLQVRNNEPATTVIYPQADEALTEGYAVTLLGTVTDTNNEPADLRATWALGGEILCADVPVAEDGSTTCDVVLEAGNPTLTLSATDIDGAEGETSVDLRIRANEAPTVDLFAPDGTGPYTSDAYLVFTADIGDAEDPPTDLTVVWTDGETELPIDTSIDTEGGLSGAWLFEAGTHTITLTATDLPGASASRSVTLVVE